MKIFMSGLATGLILQIAIGPVFFFIINLTIQRSFLDGMIAVLAVTIVDYLYISLAILGVGKLLERKKIKKSSVSLVQWFYYLRLIIIKDVVYSNISTKVNSSSSNLLTSFTSVFFLTLSSPMTIVFFTSLFATKVVELNYTKHELLSFGLATGSATFIFLGTSVILFSLIGGVIPISLIRLFNVLVGILLIGYGVVRLAVGVQNNKHIKDGGCISVK